jgi:hypothetical protein
MLKKIIFLFLVVILLAGGFFYFWRSQENVRALNETLPKGVKVEKSLLGNYKVVNKIDGYEFKVPKAWKGVEEIEYVSERTESDYTAASVSLKGRVGGSRLVTIDRFKTIYPSIDLISWATDNFQTFGLSGIFHADIVGPFKTVKTQEETHLLGMYVYFFNNDKAIYGITNGSEDFIKEIILSGKW